MIRFLLLGISASVVTGSLQTAPANAQDNPLAFFVATNGNDSWSGRLPSPNRAGTDGPFVTFKRAVQASSSHKPSSNSSSNLPPVYVRNGIFFLSEPLVLGPQ